MRGFQGRKNRTYTRKIGSTAGWTEEEKQAFRDMAKKALEESGMKVVEVKKETGGVVNGV